MNLHISKSKNCTLLYVAESKRVNGKSTLKLVEKLGSTASIMQAHDLTDEQEAIQWAKDYIKDINNKLKTENEEILVKLYPNRVRHLGDESKKKGLGYLILRRVYHQMGLNLICDNIQKRRKVTYDLNNIMESLLYARMISPASKLRTSDDVADYYGWSKLVPHHVYRSLSVFAQEMHYIQSQLFKNSQKIINRDTQVIYYDCSNFFFETEQSEGLKQYGCSKEHRPNPIVGLGLFMDKNGYPLAFCVHNGNTSETQTMIPLEEDIIKEYNLNNFIICTDAAMAIAENKIFNSAGERHFVTTQPIKKLSKKYTEWALNPTGWRRYIPMSDSDTEEEKKRKMLAISRKTTYNINEIDENEHRNTIFFKKIPFDQNIKDANGVKVKINQMLFVTYSVKYKRFQEMKRSEHIKKAEAAIKRGDSIDKHSSRDYKRLIGKTTCTKEGEVAEIVKYYIDQDVIENEKMYDGFYGISADADNSVETVMTILRNKWEIEESFRILKTDFEARPMYVSRDDRIKAHLLTCYLTLFLYRVLEKYYMREKYTATEIIESIRKMEGAVIGDGIVPLFEYNQCSQALQMHTDVLLNKEYITDKKLRKIVKDVTFTSERVKRLFETNKRPVGRPSKGSTETANAKQKEKKDKKKTKKEKK